ncbi:lipase family protein [Gordonia polyisoprenivorans]|uniref:lipase family protein n=1 Tax=Gordonia polyisoprenivorans TaxID=84595 RepID=UPI0026CAB253
MTDMSTPGRARRRALVVIVFLALCALVTGGLSAGPAHAAPPAPPSADPFYSPPAGLSSARPGAILRQREVALGYAGTGLPAQATQLLYRTTDTFGKPSSTVTTILSPPGAAPGSARKIVSYHEFYDALGSQCDPSYTLRGGSSQAAPIDLAMITTMVAAGYTVVVPDYEGPQLRWTIGRESAYAALDSIRAAERHLGVPTSTPVGLFGYSGGSIPTGFGAELAPAYAPELNLVGAAAGGVLVNPAHNLPYVNGTPRWSAVIPALMNVYDRTYDIGIGQYLSPKGTQVLDEIRGECINDFLGKYPGLTDASLLKPQYPSLLDVPGIPAAIAANVMGSVGTPRTPMMLGIGDADGRGDGVMLVGDVVGLARSYCSRGLSTAVHVYRGDDHLRAFGPFTADAWTFLQARFAGRRAGGC